MNILFIIMVGFIIFTSSWVYTIRSISKRNFDYKDEDLLD
jgi:hypothetical protein